MKVTILLPLLFFILIGGHLQEKNKKVVFEVKGNCGMCKARIEKAALKSKGVKFASWDIPSKQLTAIFDETKCSLLDLKKVIAKAGHDTKEVKASNEVYNNLPACCKYRDPGTLLMDHNKH